MTEDIQLVAGHWDEEGEYPCNYVHKIDDQFEVIYEDNVIGRFADLETAKRELWRTISLFDIFTLHRA